MTIFSDFLVIHNLNIGTVITTLHKCVGFGILAKLIIPRQRTELVPQIVAVTVARGRKLWFRVV